MNKITKRITLGLLAAGFLAGTLVWAGSEVHSNHMHGGGMGHDQQMKMHQGEHRMKQRGAGMHEMQEMQKVFQEDMRSNHAEVLAELSGKPVGEIRSQLETRSLSAVLEEYGLSHEKVQLLLQTRMTTMVSEAVESKRITQHEASRM